MTLKRVFTFMAAMLLTSLTYFSSAYAGEEPPLTTAEILEQIVGKALTNKVLKTTLSKDGTIEFKYPKGTIVKKWKLEDGKYCDTIFGRCEELSAMTKEQKTAVAGDLIYEVKMPGKGGKTITYQVNHPKE